MIVHDLKNPLTALLGFLEILRIERLTVDQGTLLQHAIRSGRNLSDLINDLLDIRRIEEGRLELEYIRITTEPPALQSSTGLGLTLCRLVVEAHGGTIGVTSVLGQQTIFRVTMPCSVVSS